MNLRAKAVIVCVAMMLPLLSLAAGRTGQEIHDEPAAAVIHLTMNRKFVPEDITINVGDTVEWVADDPFAVHTVTDDPDAVDQAIRVQLPKGAKPFDSGSLTPGSRWRYRFAVPGVYRYVCIPHQAMTGRITVRAPSAKN